MNGENKENKNNKDCLLTLNLHVAECEKDIGCEELEKIISSFSKITSRDINKKRGIWGLEEGYAYFFINRKTIEIGSNEKNPLMLAKNLLYSYAVKKGEMRYSSDNGGLPCHPDSYLKGDEIYNYLYYYPNGEKIARIDISRKIKENGIREKAEESKESAKKRRG